MRISRKHCLVLRGWKDLIATASKYVRTMVFEKFKLRAEERDLVTGRGLRLRDVKKFE